ncbi:hypothetical protein [Mariniflexile fucanivorans]|uniref:hypothetical protein n=1 Tax=Mariniflexile fucanivorans TaxID=264023 RepID=UPI001047AC87|nr:hypothetical protein [Mariniflexile fucanivorans]
MKKQIIGEEGIKVLDRFPQWDKEIKLYSNKKVKTVSENRKLQLEGFKLRKYIWENNLVPLLPEKYVKTTLIGEKFLIWFGPGLPTEKYYTIFPFHFENISLTNEQKKVIEKYGVFEIPETQGLFINRKELSEIILVLGGKKHQHLDEFKTIGNFATFPLLSLINSYNQIEDESDESSQFLDEKKHQVYFDGIRYISIWLFKRKFGISPNTNEDNYINSEEIFYKYPSLETIKIDIDNRKFDYVLGYPEKTLKEYFNV